MNKDAIIQIIKKYKWWLVGGAGAVILVGGFLIWSFSRAGLSPELNKIENEQVDDVKYRSQLNGVAVTSTEKQVPKVLAIMIDNHADARPQSGIAAAPVVYEAPVEGGITRYLAIFNKDQNISEVGPVRSARPYFLDWTKEYGNPPYLHVGGSPESLSKIKQRGLWDVDQFFWSQYYWRSSAMRSPHNVYTNSDEWNSLFEDYGARHPEQTWEGWKFGTKVASNSTASSTPVKMIKIYYSKSYVVEWRYNSDRKVYERYLNGSPYLTKENQIIEANTVVVQNVAVRVLDDEGRREILTSGKTGEARVLKNGQQFYSAWKKGLDDSKEQRDARTKFYDGNNEEITLAAGHIWIQVVPNDTKIEVGN